MPYKYPEEILEISEKTSDDATLKSATDVPGSPDTDDKGNITHKFAPFTIGAETFVRKPESTLDWKSYRFEQVEADGTRNDFSFAAKDDADAKRKVADRIATTKSTGGTFKLAALEAPRELDLSALAGGEKTVDEGDHRTGAMAKNEKAAKAEAAKPTSKRGRPSKADKANEKQAEKNAADAEAEKGDTDQS